MKQHACHPPKETNILQNPRGCSLVQEAHVYPLVAPKAREKVRLGGFSGGEEPRDGDLARPFLVPRTDSRKLNDDHFPQKALLRGGPLMGPGFSQVPCTSSRGYQGLSQLRTGSPRPYSAPLRYPAVPSTAAPR